MSKPEHLTQVERATLHRVMEDLGRAFGLDFIILVGARNGVITALSGGVDGNQEQVEQVETILRKGFHALGMPTSGVNDPRGERN